MPRLSGLPVLLAGLIGFCGAAVADPCLPANVDGAVAEGHLVVRDDAFILELAKAICLAGEGEFDAVEPTKRIHLAPDGDAIQAQLKRLIGKRIAVVGNMFGMHTQHHKAPIVMLIASATEAK